jgi:hypothetical protein
LGERGREWRTFWPGTILPLMLRCSIRSVLERTAAPRGPAATWSRVYPAGALAMWGLPHKGYIKTSLGMRNPW